MPSAATRARVARAAGDLGAAAVQQMETDHEWYRSLSAENRSWVGLVAQAGITSFLDWFGGDQAQPAVTADVFGTAPRELTRSISLAQTLDLIRTVINVVEREIADLAAPGEGDLAREAVLRYSREVAFSAAEVYAQAAEARGAWDARLESLVVDAVHARRGRRVDAVAGGRARLGRGHPGRGGGRLDPAGATAPVLTDLHRAARRTGVELLVAIHGPADHLHRRQRHRPDGAGDGPRPAPRRRPPRGRPGRAAPVRRRPQRPGRDLRAQRGARLAGGPRPVHADDLLAERALLGDLPARGALIARIVRPLAESPGGTLLDTAAAFLDGAQGVEGTARTLIVHPNTVRYRLAGITKTIGYDLTDAHDAQTVRTALAFHRLGPASRSSTRP